MAYMDSDYIIMIAVLHRNQTYIFGAETHLGAGVMSAFAFLWVIIAWALTSTFVGSTALRKGPQSFWLHCHEYCCAPMIRCQNSPWWRRHEHCSNLLSSYWLLFLTWLEQRDPHVSCALIGMRCKLADYIIQADLNKSWIWADGCKHSLSRYPQSQSRTC